MKRNYIPAFIMLLAGFVTCVLGLYYHYGAVRFSITLFIVLVCFYVLGCVVKALVCHFIPEKTEEEGEGEKGAEGEEDGNEAGKGENEEEESGK